MHPSIVALPVQVKERPIIFSGPTVRAILEGGKTQTRRVVKPAPEPCSYAPGKHALSGQLIEGNPAVLSNCPYGRNGDRLWVRETWCHTGTGVWTIQSASLALDGRVIYRADGEQPGVRWWSSIHMPRWASRLTLEITEVRVQRVQEIRDEDALTEGLVRSDPTEEDYAKERAEREEFGEPLDQPSRLKPVYLAPGTDSGYGPKEHRERWHIRPALAFEFLWDSINGERHPWSSNPWVWCLTFRALTEGRTDG